MKWWFTDFTISFKIILQLPYYPRGASIIWIHKFRCVRNNIYSLFIKCIWILVQASFVFSWQEIHSVDSVASLLQGCKRPKGPKAYIASHYWEWGQEEFLGHHSASPYVHFIASSKSDGLAAPVPPVQGMPITGKSGRPRTRIILSWWSNFGDFAMSLGHDYKMGKLPLWS